MKKNKPGDAAADINSPPIMHKYACLSYLPAVPGCNDHNNKNGTHIVARQNQLPEQNNISADESILDKDIPGSRVEYVPGHCTKKPTYFVG